MKEMAEKLDNVENHIINSAQNYKLLNISVRRTLIALALFLFCSQAVWCQSKTGTPDKPAPETQTNGGVSSNDGSGEKILEVTAAGESGNRVVVDEAKKQLEALFALTGELGKFCNKNGIKGTFVFDLTLQGKGKVVTVFMVSGDADLDDRNALKSKFSELQFSDIKIPKNERVKFRYTLTL